MKKLSLLLLAATTVAHLGMAAPAMASEEPELPQRVWPEQGILGTYDRAALQRGFQVYKEVCSACHSLKQVAYRNLEGLGYSPEQVKTIAAEATVTDGPNDEGEMFERPGRPSDHFVPPFKNDKAARAANNGALPPDMSLLVKARKGNENYIFGILTGYTEPPAGVTVNPGMHYNKVFPGHQIAMPPPLNEGQVTYADGTTASVEQMAADVTQFLSWAGEPHMEQRKAMGIKVMLFLFAFIGILAAMKRKIWSDVH